MIKVIGFDLDNTLYDQKEFEFKIFRQISDLVSKHFLIDNFKYLEVLKQLYLSGENKFFFDKALIKLSGKLPKNWDIFVKQEILKVYREYRPNNIPLYTGRNKLLKKLKKKNFKLTLITNGNSKVQNNKINGLKIRHFFDLILISDDFTPAKRKPDIFMFKESLNFFNIEPSQMIYIGDDLEKDKSSEKLGIKFLNINTINLELLEIYYE